MQTRTFTFSNKNLKRKKKIPSHHNLPGFCLINCQAIITFSKAEERRQDGVRGWMVSYAPSNQRIRQVWYSVPCGVMVCRLDLVEVRLHGRHGHGYQLIALHNKTQHQRPLFNWDKGEKRGHLKLCLPLLRGCEPSAQASLGGHRALSFSCKVAAKRFVF